MYRLKLIAAFLFLSLAVLVLLPNVNADERNKKTKVTFSQSVEIPGPGIHLLPAGTYIFKLFDSASDRHIVQIFNEDESELLATILAIPNYRLQSTDKTVMTFSERAANTPEALRAWFYPGNNWGEEFVYPRLRAVELAKIVHQPVLAMPNELAPITQQPVKSVSEEPVVALKSAPVKAIEPSGAEVEVTPFVEPPAVAQKQVEPSVALASKRPTAVARVKRLPQTASQTPLLALIGLLSMGAGITLSVISKRKIA